MHFMERRKVALFVDFDNVFSGLVERAPLAADRFGANPAQWLRWLEDGMPASFGDGGRLERSILVRKCYMNPQRYEKYRNGFAMAGFSVVDCPPLTGLGKTGADMLMVLEILDALQRDLYEEFIIFSGDADFTPVLLRLRAHDRRTAVVVTGKYARAMRGATDALIDSDVFIRFALEMPETAAPAPRTAEAAPRLAATPDPPTRTAGPPVGGAPAPAPAAKKAHAYALGADEASIIRFIRDFVTEAGQPMSLAQLGSRVRKEFDSVQETGWFKCGTFGKWLRKQPRLPFDVVKTADDVFVRARQGAQERRDPSRAPLERPALPQVEREPANLQASPPPVAAEPTLEPIRHAAATPPSWGHALSEVDVSHAGTNGTAPPEVDAHSVFGQADAGVGGLQRTRADVPGGRTDPIPAVAEPATPEPLTGTGPVHAEGDAVSAGAEFDGLSSVPSLVEPASADSRVEVEPVCAVGPETGEAPPVSAPESPNLIPLALHVAAVKPTAAETGSGISDPLLPIEAMEWPRFVLDSPIEVHAPGAEAVPEAPSQVLEVERAGCGACGAALRPGYSRCLACGTPN